MEAKRERPGEHKRRRSEPRDTSIVVRASDKKRGRTRRESEETAPLARVVTYHSRKRFAVERGADQQASSKRSSKKKLDPAPSLPSLFDDNDGGGGGSGADSPSINGKGAMSRVGDSAERVQVALRRTVWNRFMGFVRHVAASAPESHWTRAVYAYRPTVCVGAFLAVTWFVGLSELYCDVFVGAVWPTYSAFLVLSRLHTRRKGEEDRIETFLKWTRYFVVYVYWTMLVERFVRAWGGTFPNIYYLVKTAILFAMYQPRSTLLERCFRSNSFRFVVGEWMVALMTQTERMWQLYTAPVPVPVVQLPAAIPAMLSHRHSLPRSPSRSPPPRLPSRSPSRSPSHSPPRLPSRSPPRSASPSEPRLSSRSPSPSPSVQRSGRRRHADPPVRTKQARRVNRRKEADVEEQVDQALPPPTLQTRVVTALGKSTRMAVNNVLDELTGYRADAWTDDRRLQTTRAATGRPVRRMAHDEISEA